MDQGARVSPWEPKAGVPTLRPAMDPFWSRGGSGEGARAVTEEMEQVTGAEN